MTEVFSLTDWIAENRKEPYHFELFGQEFELPHLSSIDIRVTEAAESSDAEALQVLFKLGLGPDQWPAFEALEWPTDAMGELFRRWRAHAGFAPGESPASPSSSKSTAGPSTRRSAGTTRARRSAKP